MAASSGSISSATMNEKVALDTPNQEPTSTSRDSLDRNLPQNSDKETTDPVKVADVDLERGETEKPREEPTGPPAGGPPPGMAPADFPDGGLTAWLVVFGGWCGMSR